MWGLLTLSYPSMCNLCITTISCKMKKFCKVNRCVFGNSVGEIFGHYSIGFTSLVTHEIRISGEDDFAIIILDCRSCNVSDTQHQFEASQRFQPFHITILPLFLENVAYS